MTTRVHRIPQTALGALRGLRVFRGAPARLGVVAGLVVFAVLAGTSASYAYFQATQAATASAGAGTLSVTTANLSSLAYTFRNDQLDTAGSVTVTNASDTADGIARTATVALSATGDSVALNAIKFVYWAKGATETCTIGRAKTGAVSWATGASVTATLAPGASATWCVESYVTAASDLAAADGSLSITPKVAASLPAGGWSAAANSTTTQSSIGIYPGFTGMTTDWSYIRPANVGGTKYCLDVSGGADANGTRVISWPCKTAGTTNQLWKFVADGAFYGLQSNNAQTRRAEQNGTGAGSLIFTNASSTATTQDWQVQRVSAGLYQLVNRSSGLCLSATTASGDLTTQPCTDAAATQRFVVSPYLATTACTTATTGNMFAGYQTSVTYSWTTANPGPFKVYVGSALVATTAADASSVTLGPYTGGGAQTVTITDSSATASAAAGDTVVGTAAFTPRTTTAAASCSITNMVN
ncbi:MAG: ricin-type beta-trefoil lectin domain protein [Micrococcales bacterium]|nr:ricin-type beta-trefoil lectin domain protein [Micrococcales bacterium]